MAIEYTGVNNEQTPPRMRAKATHLVTVETAQFNSLDTAEKAFYQYVYDNVPAFGSPDVLAGVASISVGVNAVIGFSSSDPDVPFTSYYDLSDIVNYGASVTNIPTDATTLVANSNWKFTIANAGFVNGKHCKAAIRLDDAESQGKGELVLVDIIVLPAAPTTIAVATGGSSGEADVSWDAMDGAASYTIWYIDNAAGTETAAQIIAGGASIPGTTPGGTTITGLTPGANCRATVTATNPGGTSDGGTPDEANAGS